MKHIIFLILDGRFLYVRRNRAEMPTGYSFTDTPALAWVFAPGTDDYVAAEKFIVQFNNKRNPEDREGCFWNCSYLSIVSVDIHCARVNEFVRIIHWDNALHGQPVLAKHFPEIPSENNTQKHVEKQRIGPRGLGY